MKLKFLQILADSDVSVRTAPIYYISPSAQATLAFANIYGEWVRSEKQKLCYQAHPPFQHSSVRLY